MLTGYERGETHARSLVVYADTATTETIRLVPPAGVPAQFEVYRETPVAFGATWTLPEFEARPF